MTETIKTVPPRPKGLGLMGFIGGLLLGVLIFIGWKATLLPVQKEYLKEYAVNSVRATVDLSSLHSGAKPNRAKFMRYWYRFSIYEGKTILEFVRVPLIFAGLLALVGSLLGGGLDARRMRELRAGRVLAGPDLDSRSAFNARMRKAGELPAWGCY